ncbi:MAG: DegT/DnrJ/EryC1/StrS family aminotransferase, partial [Kofleriaceae bacterium]|nr:DegT/DnrJ/EryC1/StrS family aminotransferase [Kofleriaceae bacterium]
RGLLQIPTQLTDCEHNAHMFYILVASAEKRKGLITHLAAAGIQGVFHYVPLHSAPKSKELGFDDVDLPVTDDISARLLRLPCFYDLPTTGQDRVIAAIESFFG